MISVIEWIERYVGDPRRRRIGYGALALLLGLLCLFPQPYVVRAKLLPQDSSSAGLGQILQSLGGQFAAFAGLISGGRPANDLYLVIGRSDKVSSDVIADLGLVGPNRRYASARDAKLDLNKKVDVHLLVGGVVEVVTRSYDPDEGSRVTSAYVRAISANVASLTRETITGKQRIVRERFGQARDRVRTAGLALENFRRRNGLADAEAELGAALSLRTVLQANLQAKLIELQSIRQFAGPENQQLIQVEAQAASLRAQLARTADPVTEKAGPNLAGLSRISNQYLDLFRDYRFAQALYDVYSRASEQTAVEELVAAGASYIQVVEPVHLDPERQYNISAVAMLVILILLAVFTEVYAPATGLRWRELFKNDDHVHTVD